MLEGSLQGEYAKYTGKKEVDSLLLKPKVLTPQEANEN
jgi:hypothetical protein